MIRLTALRLLSRSRGVLRASGFSAALALTMLTNLLLAGLSLGSGVLAARLLGPTGRGELAAIQTWPTLLTMIAALGVQDALVYYSACEPRKAGGWLGTAITIAVLASAPFACAGYLLMPQLLSAQSGEVIGAAQSYLWLLPIQAVVGMLHHPLRGRNDLVAWNLIRPLPNLVWVGLLVVSVLSATKEPALIARHYLVGLVLLAIPIGIVLVRRVGGPFRPSAAQVRPLLSYGLPTALSSIPSTMNLRLDQLLMAGLLGPNILGLYVIGVAWSNSVSPLIQAVAATLLPRVVGAAQEQRLPLLIASIRLGMSLAIVLALLSAALAPLAIPLLFGAAYLPVVPSAIILCLAGGVTSFNQVLASGALSLARPRDVLVAESVGLAATLGLLWLLLPPFQLIGAAVASLVSYLIVSAVLLVLISRAGGIGLARLLLPASGTVARIIARLRTGR